MSTLTMGRQTRLKLGSKRSNKMRPVKMSKQQRLRSGKPGTGIGQWLVRAIMFLLIFSFVAVIGVGLLYTYRLATSAAYFELKAITVTGNHRLSNGDIIETAGVSLGLNSLKMNVGEVEANLSANPWIKSATIRRSIPDRLFIDIEEKVPMFWMRQGDGLYFADARGKVIAPMHPGESASLPVLSVADSLEDGPQVLTGILDKIKASETPFTQEQAAWIKLTSAHEMEIYLDGHANGQGLTIKMSMDRWEIQLERIKIAWRDLMRRGEFKDTAIIAASGEKVWIKKRPGTS